MCSSIIFFMIFYRCSSISTQTHHEPSSPSTAVVPFLPKPSSSALNISTIDATLANLGAAVRSAAAAGGGGSIALQHLQQQQQRQPPSYQDVRQQQQLQQQQQPEHYKSMERYSSLDSSDTFLSCNTHPFPSQGSLAGLEELAAKGSMAPNG